jgi:hypothetical protein
VSDRIKDTCDAGDDADRVKDPEQMLLNGALAESELFGDPRWERPSASRAGACLWNASSAVEQHKEAHPPTRGAVPFFEQQSDRCRNNFDAAETQLPDFSARRVCGFRIAGAEFRLENEKRHRKQ